MKFDRNPNARPGDDDYRRPAWDRHLERDIVEAIVGRAVMNEQLAEAIEAIMIGVSTEAPCEDRGYYTPIREEVSKLVVRAWAAYGEAAIADILVNILDGVQEGFRIIDERKPVPAAAPTEAQMGG
jgi:hypothetical protein